MTAPRAPTLADRATSIRRLILETAIRARTSHIGSSLSLVDVLVTLVFDVMRHEPHSAADRLLLSKGHAALALYATLAESGVLDEDAVLNGYCRDGGTLPGHPERGLPGVEITGGSLGHGLSLAVGLALADRSDHVPRRTFCVLGDGELNEGSVWEALGLAGHLHLGRLVAVIDANGLQGLGRIEDVLALEPLGARLDAFGWDAVEAPGHDHEALSLALSNRSDRPRAVIARTVKGYGVDFMEDELLWHYRSLTEADRERVEEALATPRQAA